MTRPLTAPPRSRRWTVAAGGGLLSLGLLLTGCVSGDAQTTGAEAENTYLDGVLASPSATSANPLQTDIDYATMLLRNHYDAVQLADAAIERGVGGEVQSLAERSRDEANARIESLTGRLQEWGVEVPERPEQTLAEAAAAEPSLSDDEQEEAMAALPAERRAGLLTFEEKSVFVESEDKDVERLYLFQLHRVQQGAVTLSITERDEGQDEQTRQISEDVLDSHGETMQRIVEILAERHLIGADGVETAEPSGYTGPIQLDGEGADGGNVDYTPSKLRDLLGIEDDSSEDESSSDDESAGSSSSAGESSDESGSSSATPSPADTASATPTPSDSGASPTAGESSSGASSEGAGTQSEEASSSGGSASASTSQGSASTGASQSTGAAQSASGADGASSSASSDEASTPGD